MKNLLTLICCLLCYPPSAWAAAALVQSGSAVASGSQVSINTTVTGVGSGNTITVGCILDSPGNCINSGTGGFSDDKSNTYVYVTNSATSVGRFVTNISYANNVASGDTVITMTPSESSFINFCWQEFSGVKNTSPLDGSNSGTADASTSASSGAITTTGSGVAVGVMYVAAAGTITPTWSGATQVYEDESYTTISGSCLYKLTTATSHTATWTVPS